MLYPEAQSGADSGYARHYGVDDGNWHHVVYTWKQDAPLELYVDGQLMPWFVNTPSPIYQSPPPGPETLLTIGGSMGWSLGAAGIDNGVVSAGLFASAHELVCALAEAECDHITLATKFMCINLAERRACKDNIQL